MSNKAECHDNAVIESFFSRLKTKLVQSENHQTREIAKSKIFEYIEIFTTKLDYTPLLKLLNTRKF